MKKNLLTIIALFALVFYAGAQTDIDGTYDGTLSVAIPGGGDPIIQDDEVILTKNVDNTYSFVIENLTVMIPIGDIAIDGINAEQKDGYVQLTREGSVNIPESPIPGTTASLASAKVEEGIFSLLLNVEVPGGVGTVVVDFKGDKKTSGIFSPKAPALSIYPTILTTGEEINVAGVETAVYAIYTQTGAKVQSGTVQSGKVNVNRLGKGVYFLNVAGKTATFIKK